MAPLGTPPAVIRALSSEIGAIMAKPDVQAKVALLSVEPDYTDEKAFGAYLMEESIKTKEIIKGLPAAPQ
jgi:tripartite-type tricarboxylate transporter receptor subunit TctC